MRTSYPEEARVHLIVDGEMFSPSDIYNGAGLQFGDELVSCAIGEQAIGGGQQARRRPAQRLAC